MEGPSSSRTEPGEFLGRFDRLPDLRDDEVGDLDVHASLLQVHRGFEDRLRPRGGDVLPKEPGFPAPFEIDAHRVEMRADQRDRLGGHVPVRHEVREEADLVRLPHHVEGVLGEDRRLVVGERHPAAAEPPRFRYGDVRGQGPSHHLMFLRDLGVLAVRAAPVAPDRADRVDPGPRMEVREGFLLDRVDLRRGGLAVAEEDEATPHVLADEAEPVRPVGDRAGPGRRRCIAPSGRGPARRGWRYARAWTA